MDKSNLIQDTGILEKNGVFEFSISDSFESISNLFNTIKEYREFANPDDNSWFDYIHQFFQILGFNTFKIAPRLFALRQMGFEQINHALVCVVGANESFDQIAYGLNWESYLFYAAKFHQVEWVILTNGLQFKVLNYSDNADFQKYFQCELDEIIKRDEKDSFFTLYKVLSAIKHSERGKKIYNKGVANKPKRNETSISIEQLQFWQEYYEFCKNQKGERKLIGSTPKPRHWHPISIGKSGFEILLTVNSQKGLVGCEIYINNDREKINFDQLYSQKDEIENALGYSLQWNRLDRKKASRIRGYHSGAIRNAEERQELIKWLYIQANEFYKIFYPRILKLEKKRD